MLCKDDKARFRHSTSVHKLPVIRSGVRHYCVYVMPQEFGICCLGTLQGYSRTASHGSSLFNVTDPCCATMISFPRTSWVHGLCPLLQRVRCYAKARTRLDQRDRLFVSISDCDIQVPSKALRYYFAAPSEGDSSNAQGKRS